MKKYYNKKEISIPIYKGKIILVFSNDVKKVNKKYNKDYTYTFASSMWQAQKGKERFIIILNFHNGTDKIEHGTIAHEAAHIAGFILQSRGIVADFNNDEPFAYLIQWITNEIYKFIKEKNYENLLVC